MNVPIQFFGIHQPRKSVASEEKEVKLRNLYMLYLIRFCFPVKMPCQLALFITFNWRPFLKCHNWNETKRGERNKRNIQTLAWFSFVYVSFPFRWHRRTLTCRARHHRRYVIHRASKHDFLCDQSVHSIRTWAFRFDTRVLAFFNSPDSIQCSIETAAAPNANLDFQLTANETIDEGSSRLLCA